MWQIDIRTGRQSEIQLSEPVTKGDGLTWGKDNRLYVIRNFENKISMIDFAENSLVKTVTSVLPEGVSVPTTAAFTGEELVVVNSQFGVKQPLLPFNLSVIR